MRVRGAYISRTCASRRRADRPRRQISRRNGPSIPDYLRADAVKIFTTESSNIRPRPPHCSNPISMKRSSDASNRVLLFHPGGPRSNRHARTPPPDGAHTRHRRPGVRSALDAIAMPAPQRAGTIAIRSPHLELVQPADFPRFKQLNVIANFQLQWAIRDFYVENATINTWGPNARAICIRRDRCATPARDRRAQRLERQQFRCIRSDGVTPLRGRRAGGNRRSCHRKV